MYYKSDSSKNYKFLESGNRIMDNCSISVLLYLQYVHYI